MFVHCPFMCFNSSTAGWIMMTFDMDVMPSDATPSYFLFPAESESCSLDFPSILHH
jgi:hypothetical protein